MKLTRSMTSPFWSEKFSIILLSSAISSSLAFIASSAASLRSFSWATSALVLLLLAVILQRLAPVPFKAKVKKFRLVTCLSNRIIECTYCLRRSSCWKPDKYQGPFRQKDFWSQPWNGSCSWSIPWPSLWMEHLWLWKPRWLSIASAGARSPYDPEESTRSILSDCWERPKFFLSWEIDTGAHKSILWLAPLYLFLKVSIMKITYLFWHLKWDLWGSKWWRGRPLEGKFWPQCKGVSISHTYCLPLQRGYWLELVASKLFATTFVLKECYNLIL